jgi:hypothetical protein
LGGPHIRSVNFGEEKFLDTAWNLTPVPQSWTTFLQYIGEDNACCLREEPSLFRIL